MQGGQGGRGGGEAYDARRRRRTETKRMEGRSGRKRAGEWREHTKDSRKQQERERTMAAMMRRDERNGTVI